MVCFDLPVKRCERDRAWLSQPLPLSSMQNLKVWKSGLAGTKVGPDQLGPPVRVGSTRIDSDRLES